jgi:hypothetical protein
VKSLTLTMEVLMRLRPTGSAAVVLAAVTLAMTAASPRPAEAFFFLPMLFQNQPIDSRQQQSTPTDNRSRDHSAKPIKPSTTTRSRDDDDKPSSSSAGKKAKTSTKSEAKTNSGQTSRSWSKQEPPASKSSSRASTAARSGNSGGAKTPTQEPSPGGGGTATATQQPASPGGGTSTNVQQATSTGPGSNLGDTLDEKLGDVFKARIDELLKQPPK